MFRRLPSRLEPALDAFRDVVEHVERAKGLLTDAVPTTRLPGRPLAESVAGFEEELGEAEALMASWRVEDVEEVWAACSDGLDQAHAAAEALRLGAAAPAGFEGLIGAIGDLLAPLDAFGEAAERFRALRTRR